MAERRVARPDYSRMEETELVRRARSGEPDAFRAIMERGNQRLFRIARGVVRDDAEAEDVLQEAYVRAFAHLDAFRGDASVITWLARITINEANGRLRRRRATVGVEALEAAQSKGGHVIMFPGGDPTATPESDVARLQVRRVLETAIDELPADFRIVFIMRDIEGCSVAETAAALGVREETVKTRLHRARRQLRSLLSARLAASTREAFVFLGPRCQRITERVMERLGLQGTGRSEEE